MGERSEGSALTETLLGAMDASKPLQWWGYLRGDGTVIVKRYEGMGAVEEVAATEGVPHVRGPFVAFGRGAALARLRDKIATAKTRAAHRRLEAMRPSKLS